MTAQEFAAAYRRAAIKYEASWNSSMHRYLLTTTDACEEFFPPEWVVPATCLMVSGYADMDDWCNQHDPIPA